MTQIRTVDCGTEEFWFVTTAPTMEQALVLREFTKMLKAATVDGGHKRAAGTKAPWWKDDSHMAALFSHLNKYFHGEYVDEDSGAHPFVHLAWRALAIAYQDTHGKVNPSVDESAVDQEVEDEPQQQ